ncbi:MAG: NDP-sugar synthase [bacterium]
MKAVFHTGGESTWGDVLGDRPWCLAPIGGKPLLEYWLEWAALLKADDVRIVLGDGAYEIEAYCGDGSRWGLKIQFGFLKSNADPAAYLRRAPDQWKDGLLYISGPVFPRRLALPPWPDFDKGKTLLLMEAGKLVCLLSRHQPSIQALLSGSEPVADESWAALGLDPIALTDVKSYYDLNMRIVGHESVHYVQPGYSSRDNSIVGYNVLITPSVELRPPLIIGNDCRIHPMAIVGPNAVIGNHVIVDRQTELSDCVVIDDTYLGRNLEIKGKIISGSRIISPDDGSFIEIPEPWLLSRLVAHDWINDFARAVLGWALAIILMLIQTIPIVLLYPLIRLWGIGRYGLSSRLGSRLRLQRIPVWTTLNSQSRLGRAFVGLGLDLFPSIVLAAAGRLWLCGHVPSHPEQAQAIHQGLHRYFPAAIDYGTRRSASRNRLAETTDALYYERYRSPLEDIRMLFRTLAGRLLDALSGTTPEID